MLRRWSVAKYPYVLLYVTIFRYMLLYLHLYLNNERRSVLSSYQRLSEVRSKEIIQSNHLK